MLKFNKRVLEMDVYGEIVEIPFPSVDDFCEFEKERANSESEQQVDLMVNFISKLGMKEELIRSLEPSHLIEIVNELSGAGNKKGKK